MVIVARAQYDERGVFASDLDFKDSPSLTKQGDLKDCDINSIFKRYERTGQLPDLIAKDGRYGDFSAVPDYQAACDIVNRAREQFDALDVHVRNRFANDPVKFLEFVSDPKNIDEIEKMGLLNAEAVTRRNAERKAASDAAKVDRSAVEAQDEKVLIEKIKAAILATK